MMWKTMIAAALLAAPMGAEARDWRFAGQAQGAVMIFIDVDSIDATAGPYPRGMTLMVLASEDGRFAAYEALLEFDCDAHRRRGIEGRGYDGDGVVVQTAGAENRWNEQQPGRLLSNAEDVICGRQALTGRSYGSGVPIAEGRAILAGEQP